MNPTNLTTHNCDKGHRGDCCCNCKYFAPVMKHPGNKQKWAKGSMSEQIGWACLGFENSVIFSSNSHGMCEMHSRLTNKEQAAKKGES